MEEPPANTNPLLHVCVHVLPGVNVAGHPASAPFVGVGGWLHVIAEKNTTVKQ